ncbi:MAG: acetyl-CoA hydrolase [Alphaproteobacteria bacterium]|nr:acetyl-CoA hydrolase [Alphaproteobacteria bacterium]
MKTGRPEDVLDWLKPGARIFVQGATGEPAAFIETLRAAPDRLVGVDLWSCLVPGINTFDYGALHPEMRFTSFMASPALAASIASGTTTIRNLPYSQIGPLLDSLTFDAAILQVAPPQGDACSFGVCCDTGPIVWPRARRRIAYINSRMPRIANAETLPLDAIDLAIETDEPLIAAAAAKSNETLAAIARIAAPLVPDGAAIQSGIGQAPGAVIAALDKHRGLSIHSGLVTPEYRRLAEAGALDEGAAHLSGIAYGDKDFYAWLGETGLIAFRSILETHSPAGLAATPGFTSINSALEVDLSGALNIEWLSDRRISSLGGAPDYIRGAVASRGGRSIIALPATTRTGASRILPRLAPGAQSIAGEETDVIVTEHGAAELRGLGPEARARALIAIAAPEHREMLERSIG